MVRPWPWLWPFTVAGASPFLLSSTRVPNPNPPSHSFSWSFTILLRSLSLLPPLDIPSSKQVKPTDHGRIPTNRHRPIHSLFIKEPIIAE
ncbi:hypothetical protein BDW75DRAFT_123802 [Aspergillus navahoensis]